MQTKYKVIICVVIILTAFVFGRYSAPEKVKIEKQIVEVEKKQDKSKQTEKKHTRKKITIVKVKKPDGTETTTTTIVDDSDQSKNSSSNDTTNIAKNENDTKEITRSGSHLSIAALAGSSVHLGNGLSLGPTVYGAQVSRNLIGPINVGIWGLSSGEGGVSLGLTF